MTPGQIDINVKRSLLHEQVYKKVLANETILADVTMLFQLMVGDAALVFPDTDCVSEFDQSPAVLEYIDQICAHCDIRTAKRFIIGLGRLGFDNLQYNLVCKWHMAFSLSETKEFQTEARNLMVMIR